MIKKGLLIGLITLSVNLVLNAQPSIPVDLSSGRAYVSVPITELSFGDLSVPVSLSYNSSGVRVAGSEGPAGMNWNLNAGGKVTREVRGLPDDYNGNQYDATDTRKGWLLTYAEQVNNFNANADDNLLDCSDEFIDWTWLNDLQYERDSEPDVFSFSAPGLSGSFVFGPDGQPKLLSYQDLKFDFIPADLSGPISSITITTNTGYKYTFGATETITRQTKLVQSQTVTQFISEFEYYKKATKFHREWSLTEMKSPSGAVISLKYSDDTESPWNIDNYTNISYSTDTLKILNILATATNDPNFHYQTKDIIKKQYLYKITGSNKQAFFRWGHYNAQILTEVFIRAKDGNEKTFNLDYVEAVASGEEKGKYFLRNVIEQDDIYCEKFPAYSFDYYGVGAGESGKVTSPIPFERNNENQDLWGYFNNTAQSLNPKIYFYNNKSNGERYRFYPIPGESHTAIINGADRSVNPSAIYFGSLETIQYPTGGTATILYEPNTYFDEAANQDQYGPGLRVSQITYRDPIGNAPDTWITYDYNRADGYSSGKWIYKSVFGYHDVDHFYATVHDQSKEPFILYENVKVAKSGMGYSEYEYLLPGMYPLTSQNDWSTSKTNIARGNSANCADLGKLKKQYYQFPFGPSTNYDFERGLLNRVTDYTANGTKVMQKDYTYQRLSTPVEVVKGIKYQKLNNTSNLSTGANTDANLFVYNNYSLLSNIGMVVLTETQRIFESGDVNKALVSTQTFNYNSIHHLLQEVTSVNSDGKTYFKRYNYVKDFDNLTQPSTSDTHAGAIKALNDGFRHGILVESISGFNNGSDVITGANLNLFDTYTDSQGADRILPSEVLIFNGTSGFNPLSVSPVSGSNQHLQYDSYRSQMQYLSYNDIGQPLTVTSKNRLTSSTHYGKHGMPVANIAFAAASEVVYDGFETISDMSFDVKPRQPTYDDAMLGARSLVLNSGERLEKNDISKGSTTYKYSVRVKSTTSTNVTLEVVESSVTKASATISYTSSDVGQWRTFKGEVNLANVGSTFQLKVSTSATANIDEVIFLPKNAEISTTTYHQINGVTSETDTKGRSTYYEYDNLGRLKYVKDQDGNLSKTYDYYYAVQPKKVLSAEFNGNYKPYQVVKDVTVDYTALEWLNCGFDPVTYDWYIDDVKVLSGSPTFTYTFSEVRKYVVKLIASHPTYGQSEKSVPYDVKDIGTGPIGIKMMDVTSGDFEYNKCDGIFNKTFKAALQGCWVLEDVNITWYYLAGSNWKQAGDSHSTISEDKLSMTLDALSAFNGISNLDSYSIKMEVNTVCPVTGSYSSKSQIFAITYIDNSPCQ